MHSSHIILFLILHRFRIIDTSVPSTPLEKETGQKIINELDEEDRYGLIEEKPQVIILF